MVGNAIINRTDPGQRVDQSCLLFQMTPMFIKKLPVLLEPCQADLPFLFSALNFWIFAGSLILFGSAQNFSELINSIFQGCDLSREYF